MTDLGRAAGQENAAIMKALREGTERLKIHKDPSIHCDARSTRKSPGGKPSKDSSPSRCSDIMTDAIHQIIFSSDLMVAINAGDVAEQTRFVAATQFYIALRGISAGYK